MICWIERVWRGGVVLVSYVWRALLNCEVWVWGRLARIAFLVYSSACGGGSIPPVEVCCFW